ncbi:hypothetical protein B5F40_03390 [Gordonibacter sp. An230]|uniref:helix-turn-helix domain-containing protein n=1 Tax=Gordonibacter sp. An230 TaxID=1965592 RepID=UPI000B38EA16|nr:RodZ domain-containing protein [Gordonibacter sp. An230]OUO91491.1 hypothetical protein B5F40_03390 [Gordonibacter sp. An230]
MTFGTILREARERKGYDLAQAARRLRIRPDILRAIEEGDFARMPPRGYTRNMVNAYARLVGLNPSEMTRQYIDEAYAYQVGCARTDQPLRREGGGRSRRTRSGAAQSEEERPPRQNAFGRTLYDDRRDYARGDGARAAGAGGRRLEGRTHPSRHAALPNTQYTNFYAGPKAPNAVQSKLPFVIAGGAVLVLLVVVLAFVFGGQKAEEDGPKVHVSGLSDPTTEESQNDAEDAQGRPEEDAAQTKPEEVAPTSAKVEVSVASGEEAWLDVYEGDVITFGDSVAGPETLDYEVTDVPLRVVTSNPDAVSVTVNGEGVEPAADESTGVYTYEVDFAAVLEKWKADHPDAADEGAGEDEGV